MKQEIINFENKVVSEMSLNPNVFGLDVRTDILHRMVEWQRAKRQAGTHKTKTISEISGTTAKPFKQKGTGNARQGSKRAAHHRGGQTTFGPVVRSHAHSLTKKFRALALRTALSAKKNSGELFVMDSVVGDFSKTKDFAGKMANVGFVKPLIVDVTVNDVFFKAARNVKNVDVLPVVGINVYDILRHKELVLTKGAVEALEGRLA
jgi:large subunit ribosomal protein L4